MYLLEEAFLLPPQTSVKKHEFPDSFNTKEVNVNSKQRFPFGLESSRRLFERSVHRIMESMIFINNRGTCI